MKNLIVIFSAFYSCCVLGECRSFSVKDFFKNSKYIMHVETIESNSSSILSPNFIRRIFGYADHEAELKVLDVLKGETKTRKIFLDYSIVLDRHPGSIVFVKGWKYFIGIKSIDENGISELASTSVCDYGLHDCGEDYCKANITELIKYKNKN